MGAGTDTRTGNENGETRTKGEEAGMCDGNAVETRNGMTKDGLTPPLVTPNQIHVYHVRTHVQYPHPRSRSASAGVEAA